MHNSIVVTFSERSLRFSVLLPRVLDFASFRRLPKCCNARGAQYQYRNAFLAIRQLYPV